MLNQNLSAQKKLNVEDALVKISADETALHVSADTGGIARKALWVLALGFGGFLLWASLAPLDEGVPTPGMVTIDTS